MQNAKCKMHMQDEMQKHLTRARVVPVSFLSLASCTQVAQ